MDVERLEEEVVLVKKEMISFINFYKDQVLSSLVKQCNELQHLLGKLQINVLCSIVWYGMVSQYLEVVILLNYYWYMY